MKLGGDSQGRKLRAGVSVKVGGTEVRAARTSDGDVTPAFSLPSPWDLAFPSLWGRRPTAVEADLWFCPHRNQTLCLSAAVTDVTSLFTFVPTLEMMAVVPATRSYLIY